MSAVRVLIADDYADTAQSLAMLLEITGNVETEIAMRGDEALERAIDWQPHLCVLDIDLPGCDGREIASRIGERPCEERPYLVALTGWTSKEDRESAFQAGFDEYLIKPVDIASLLAIIRRVRFTVEADTGCSPAIRT